MDDSGAGSDTSVFQAPVPNGATHLGADPRPLRRAKLSAFLQAQTAAIRIAFLVAFLVEPVANRGQSTGFRVHLPLGPAAQKKIPAWFPHILPNTRLPNSPLWEELGSLLY